MHVLEDSKALGFAHGLCVINPHEPATTYLRCRLHDCRCTPKRGGTIQTGYVLARFYCGTW